MLIILNHINPHLSRNIKPGLITARLFYWEVPFNYQIMTIVEVPPLVNKLWFVDPGLTISGYHTRYD